jgi:lipopolysaccharide/colanic/teichoic acid biosynthesis glycosyltransferase
MKFLTKMNSVEMILRIFDVFFSLLLLILFSPLILLFSFLIKITDLKSPIFADNHWRVGKNGKIFFMYKFRTMIPNAHELLHKDPKFSELKKKYDGNGAKLKLKDDVRLTPVGKLVRRFDFDELPQLFNVLKGEMSLVGPRAYFKEEIDSYAKKYPAFRKKIKDVLKLKPGMTGLWQISGRNLLTIPQIVVYDYEYFKKKSILFYILILLKTPLIVLTRYGAYE